MHEHRRLGVPVRLGADVDAGHDDVDLAARLRELDDPPQHGGDPVHVLGAAVHRDLRPGGEREPLERDAELLGEVERGDDAPALGLGQRARAPCVGSPSRITRSMPSGWRSVTLRIEPDDDARRVGRRRAVDRARAGRPRRGRARRTARRLVGGRRVAGASSLTISAGCSSPRRRAEMIRCAPSSSGCSGCVGGSSTSTTTPRPAGVKKRSTRSRTCRPASRSRPWTSSISTPRPAVARRQARDQRRGSPRAPARSIGQTCSSDAVPLQAPARLAVAPGSGGCPRAPRRACARARAAR